MCVLIKSSYYTSASITVSSETCRVLRNDDSQRPSNPKFLAAHALRKVNVPQRALLSYQCVSYMYPMRFGVVPPVAQFAAVHHLYLKSRLSTLAVWFHSILKTANSPNSEQ